MTAIPPPPSKVPPLRQQSNAGQAPPVALFVATASLGSLGNVNGALPAPLAPVPVGNPISQSTAEKMIPSTSGVPSKTVVMEFENKERELEQDESEGSATASESSSDEGTRDSEAEEEDVAENQSAKISNRSSPSVLSATIHQWPGYEEESHGLLDNNEEGSEDSENEDPDDPWRILPEQRGWYLSLFVRLQPDVHGFIEGKDARVFFENSQLPLQDLGEIWNCSDVDRDGKLTLAEFCYAMHLSVARRHGLTLPSQLPLSLRNSTKHILKAAEENTPSALSSGDHMQTPEWTKFSESPRNRGPVQFRSTLDCEKNLPHPVAIKPSSKSSASAIKTAAVRDSRSYSAGTVNMPHSLSLAGQHPPAEAVIAPPPPPRSFHSRSASLDLQGQQQQQQPVAAVGKVAAPPPQLPPRSSPIRLKRFDSASSESDNETGKPAAFSSSDVKPEKPPRITKTPGKNVSFAPSAEASDIRPSIIAFPTNSLPPILEIELPIPSVHDLETMKPREVAALLQRFKTVVDGLSRQNVDLQQQLTEVVLRKRTAESHLAAEKTAQKS